MQGGESWPLTGRAEELDFIGALVAKDGPTAIVIAGPAGVGKTRLAREVLETLTEQGWSGALAVATRAASSIPFGALAHLLPEVSGSAPSRYEVIKRAADALAGPSGTRTLLAVDDAHLADDATATLLHSLALTRRMILLLTIRSGESVPDPIVSLWKDGHATRVDLQPLGQADADQLLETALGGQVDGATRHRLWTLSQGNVLFLRELVLGGIDTGALARRGDVWQWAGPAAASDRLSEILEARVGAVDVDVRTALEVLATSDAASTIELGGFVGENTLIDAERRGLISIERQGLRRIARLTHPLYSEVVRRRTPTAFAERVQRQLADGIEAQGLRRREDVLRVATWRMDAGGAVDGALLLEAARRATATYDHPVAARLAEAARSAGAGPAADLVLGEAMYWMGKFEEAVAALPEVDDGEDDLVAGCAIHGSASLFWGLGRLNDALTMLDRAIERIASHERRSEVRAHRGSILLFTGQPLLALGDLEAVLGDASAGPRAHVRALASAAGAWALSGSADRTLLEVPKGLPLAMECEPELPLAPGQLMVAQALAHWSAGRFDEGETIAKSLYAFAASRGADDARGAWSLALGRASLSRGRVQTAARWLQESSAILRTDDIGRFLPWCLGVLAQARALSGDVAGATAALEEAESAHLDAVSLFDVDIALARVWIAAAKGEVTSARGQALESAAVEDARGQRFAAALAYYDAARLGAVAESAEALRRLAEDVDGPMVAAMAAHATALETGDGTELEAAAVQLEEFGALLFAAEAMAAAARAHDAAGLPARRSNALAHFARLAACCEGARTPTLDLAGASDLLAALSSRELEVALLAARGGTSRQIAERLFVSVRTVDNHLQRVYGKLGVSGRSALVAFFPHQ